MTVVLDLRDQELRATGCGRCQGSHSDNMIRAKREPEPQPAEETDEQAEA